MAALRVTFFVLIAWLPLQTWALEPNELLHWEELTPLPNELGVAGPFAGVHNNALLVAGGANFPKPVWESEKVWHDEIHVLTKSKDAYLWTNGGRLPRPIAYGASVSTDDGVLCIGGNDSDETFSDVFLLKWDAANETVVVEKFPVLPAPCAYASATMVGGVVFVAGGQRGPDLESAMTNFWSLDLSQRDQPKSFRWKQAKAWPGPARAFNLTVTQHNGYENCVYVISGRCRSSATDDPVEFLKDVWEYSPTKQSWRQRSDAPTCLMAGTAIGFGQSHILVLSGDDGEFFFRGNELKDQHPGFPKKAYAYHTITDRWVTAGTTPANHVTTVAVKWDDEIIVPSGEVRPRVRSAVVYRVSVSKATRDFGALNYIVLFGYLATMLGIGVHFTRKNKNTNDYFRGGQNIPWWAAGCSIFATMLSSLTFTGIPSKSFAQDWVYAVGNFTIPVVAIIAVYAAMPFFRRIDATSAYEYLEKRFSRSVRWFGSISFMLFHVFRMAVVMSLTGLVLSIATPLTPAQSVLLMGTLSILYCTLGGIEAVIWTDTIQTFVLMGGAVLAFCLLVVGIDGGFGGFVTAANDADKLNLANFHWDATQSQIAFWVIVVGGIAQNLSSYTADQAVVQRYMTTATNRLAARSIWTNAVLTVPSTLLFFGIGTALFAFYQTHPDRLDPSATTDQVFPLFIAREMPAGVAGLIVAGVFAAAQSTVSTSMNSTATALVTDFLRPLRCCKTEQGFLNAARFATLLFGLVGTLIGLLFVDPDIKSLFDEFIKVIGLFMGVLGGLFLLGAVVQRANAAGAICGGFVGACVMAWLWSSTSVNGYLYTAAGVSSCFIVGVVISVLTPPPRNDLSGLTLYTLSDEAESA
ncbi:MAG: sodium/solute symporter [Planctomycetota bacterium]